MLINAKDKSGLNNVNPSLLLSDSGGHLVGRVLSAKSLPFITEKVPGALSPSTWTVSDVIVITDL